MASTSVVFDILARDRASDKFDHLGRSIGGTSSKMSKFTGVMKTAGKAAAYGLGAGLVIAAAAGVKFVEAAIEDEKAAALLEGALQKNADATDEQVAATERWITAQGKAKGVTDDELRPALARLVTATQDVGKAQDLASLAMDVSAATGKSLESVSTALMKAQNGQVSSLSRLGINTKDAAGETITMTEATKRMSDQFGGAATEKANTLSGKIGRLKLMFSEAGESLGKKLIPYVEQFADWTLNKAVPAIEKFIRQMENGRGEGGRFADKLDHLKEVLKKVSGFVLEHKEDIAKLTAAYFAAKQATKLWTAAQLLLNLALAANPLGLTILALAAVAGGFILAYKKSEAFRNAVNRVWSDTQKVGGQIAAAFDSITGAIGRAVGQAKELYTWITNLGDKIANLPGGFWDKAKGGLLGSRMIAGTAGKDAGEAWMAGFIKGTERDRGKWLAFLAGLMSDQLAAARSAMADLRDRRNQFANFSGFRGNLFGADISGQAGATKDAQGNDVAGPTGLAALKAYAAAEALKAKQLATDVAKLTDMGISQDLLDDLKSQGASGLAQIHALASASQEEANQIFADMAAANADYQKAGNEAASRLDEQMGTMGAALAAMARSVAEVVGAPPVVNIKVDLTGKTVVTTVKAEERATGKTYWYPVSI